MMQFEPFDLKLAKLTGNGWDRFNLRHLAEQLLDGQGNPRHSIENRIIVLFDRSPNSGVEFFKSNEAVIIKGLIEIAKNPCDFAYWIHKYECWVALYLIASGKYIPNPDYYEHPIALGFREPEKAEFEKELIVKVSPLCNFAIRPNRQYKEIGKDGELKIDVEKLRHSQRESPKQLAML